MNEEYIPAPSRKAVRLVVHTPRIRIIAMSTNGSRLRTSTPTQIADTTSPATSSAIVFVLPQPQTVVWAIAISTAAIPMLNRLAAEPVDPPGRPHR